MLIFFLIQSFAQRLSETEKESKERVDHLERRKRKLKRLVEKKKNHKRWLDWIFRILDFITRVFVLGLGALCFYSANWWYTDQHVTLDQYLSWGAFLAVCFSSITYLIYGNSLTILKVLQELRPSLETFVYGKYIGIGQDIDLQEKELDELKRKVPD